MSREWAPVQSDAKRPAGRVPWDEHFWAWSSYSRTHPTDARGPYQIADLGGFSYSELEYHLGRLGKRPSWEPQP